MSCVKGIVQFCLENYYTAQLSSTYVIILLYFGFMEF